MKPGDLAPAFSAPDQVGAERSLHEFLQRGPVVLFFYPLDFTFVCPVRALISA